MHSASVSSAGSQNGDDPLPGFQVSYVRDLYHGTRQRWGVKATFGYMPMNFCSGGVLGANEQLITDAYALHGVTPPVAPYSGSFGGPGVVIGSAPTRSISPGVATIIGSRSVNATLYDFRIGPSIDLDLTKRLSVEFGGGFAFGVVDSTFSYNETAVGSGLGSATSAGGNSGTTCQVGTFVEAGVAYRLCSAASIFGGAEFQDLGNYNQTVGAHNFQLDLTQSVFLVLGVEFHF
jgi:hypothetical protein